MSEENLKTDAATSDPIDLPNTTEDQRQLIRDGMTILGEVDAETLNIMIDGGMKLLPCTCGPNGEPGLSRW